MSPEDLEKIELKKKEKEQEEEEEKQRKNRQNLQNSYFSVPVRLSLTLNKTHQIKTIIKRIKNIKFLELEPDKDNLLNKIDLENENTLEKYNIETYTSFIFGTRSHDGQILPVSKDMTIDQCYQEQSAVLIFEVLNSRGINEIKKPFNYQKEENKDKETKNEKQNNNNNNNDNGNNNNSVNDNESTLTSTSTLNSNSNNIILSNYTFKIDPKNFPQLYQKDTFNLKTKDEIITLDNTLIFYPKRNFQTIESISESIKNFEYPIKITYYYPLITNDNYLFHKFYSIPIQFNIDILIFNTTENNFTARMLYDYILEKNRKFLASPNKSDDEIWWRTKKKTLNIVILLLLE